MFDLNSSPHLRLARREGIRWVRGRGGVWLLDEKGFAGRVNEGCVRAVVGYGEISEYLAPVDRLGYRGGVDF
jgi:hypothetical protein